jgi:glycosyltransferase involved in cell wall biosynthesis
VPKLLEAFDLARLNSSRKLKLILAGPRISYESEGIHLVGELPHSELAEWLKMSDFAVFPFAPEMHPYLKLGFYWSPLKLFEAMAMELPLITLHQERLIKIVGQEEGGFYFDGSIANLSEKIVGMVHNLDRYRELAKNFRNRILENFSWQQHGRKLSCWLEEVRKQ